MPLGLNFRLHATPPCRRGRNTAYAIADNGEFILGRKLPKLKRPDDYQELLGHIKAKRPEILNFGHFAVAQLCTVDHPEEHDPFTPRLETAARIVLGRIGCKPFEPELVAHRSQSVRYPSGTHPSSIQSLKAFPIPGDDPLGGQGMRYHGKGAPTPELAIEMIGGGLVILDEAVDACFLTNRNGTHDLLLPPYTTSPTE